MRTATTKVRREVYEVFRVLCEKQGRTPYGVLQELLLAWMDGEVRRLFESGDPAVCAAAAEVGGLLKEAWPGGGG